MSPNNGRNTATALNPRPQRHNLRAALRTAAPKFAALIERLEERQMLSTGTTTSVVSSTGSSSAPIVQPLHIVVVIEEDRYANAIGDTANMPYINQLASSGLLYSNTHSVSTSAQDGQMDYLALYSGSNQGVTDNANHGIFTAPNLAQSLNNAGWSFRGYAESMPANGDMTSNLATDPTNSRYTDLYVRAYNPMAQFSNVGTGLTNANVNLTFSNFPTTTAGYAALPTVSFVIPNTRHNTHGSNETDPFATDPSQYNFLRQSADAWLQQKLDGYLQWAKLNNSILIITGDEGDKSRNFAAGFPTIVNGSTNLFTPGTDTANVNQYNILRTIEDMYGLTKLGATATTSGLDINGQGKLGVPTTGGASSVFGQSVTFTATVAPVTSGTGTPTGSVTFKDGASTLGISSLNASGQAAFSTAGLSVAAHSITAVYGSDVNFTASTSPALTQTVTRDSTTTALVSSLNPALAGQTVTLTATVSAVAPGSGIAGGSISFLDGATTVATLTLNSSGAASWSSSTLSVGSHSFSAVYAGNTNFTGSTSSTLSQTVNPNQNTAPTSTAVVSSLPSSVFGQAMSFSATVTPTQSSVNTPSGSMQFTIDGVNFGLPVPLVNGSATSNSTANLSVGSHNIAAVYSGDGNFSSSTAPAISRTVNKASTTTGVISSSNPSNSGQSVTFTVTVAAVVPGAGVATGSVTLYDGVTSLGTGSINGSGNVAFTTAALSFGSHSITAVYAGDTNFIGSTSSALTQQVNSAPPAVPTNVSATKAVYTDRVRITWSVASGATAYDVWRATSSSSAAATKLNASDITTTSFDDTTAVVGITYWYWVKSRNAGGGTSAFSSSSQGYLKPANDNFVDATVLTGTSIAVTGSNFTATKQSGEPKHAGNKGGHSVWYAWTASTSGTATIDTVGSDFDTLLAVYTGSSVSSLSTVSSNDNNGGSNTSKVTFNVSAGTTYRIAVDGRANQTGNIVLHLALV